jgi:Tn3 transposase DDE domain-containing protein
MVRRQGESSPFFTLFMLDWPESPRLRQMRHAELNKNEQLHALDQMICTFKQRRIAGRGRKAQKFRAPGLNLMMIAANGTAGHSLHFADLGEASPTLSQNSTRSLHIAVWRCARSSLAFAQDGPNHRRPKSLAQVVCSGWRDCRVYGS